MKKFSVFIVLLICAVSICCFSKEMRKSAVDIEIKNIEGHYTNDGEITNTVIELVITKDGNGYNYEMNTP